MFKPSFKDVKGKESILFITFKTVLVSLFFLGSISLTAQTPTLDESEINLSSEIESPKEAAKTLSPMYKEALKKAFHSAVLPTWGQWDNKQSVKSLIFLPVMVGSVGGGIAQGANYKDYKTAYDLRLEGFTNDNYYGILTDFELSQKLNQAKKRRNWSYALAGSAYGLQVLDAYLISIIRDKNQAHSPSKAAYLSAILPGLGQIYNEKYWKLPIVYGALGFATYRIVDNTQKHNAFKNAYVNFGVEGFEPDDITIGFTESGLLNARQVYLRNVEVSWIFAGVLYALNILDAVVDAHLFDFDVSDDLSITTQPMFNNNSGIVGGSIVVKF